MNFPWLVYIFMTTDGGYHMQRGIQEPMTNPDIDDYKKFFDETPVALIRTDIKTGKFLMANKFAAELLGFESVEELKEKATTIDFYPTEDRKKLIQRIRKIGLIENYEIKLKTPKKTVTVSVRLRMNCGGTCIEGSLIDITHYAEVRDNCLLAMKDISNKLDKKIASLAG